MIFVCSYREMALQQLSDHLPKLECKQHLLAKLTWLYMPMYLCLKPTVVSLSMWPLERHKQKLEPKNLPGRSFKWEDQQQPQNYFSKVLVKLTEVPCIVCVNFNLSCVLVNLSCNAKLMATTCGNFSCWVLNYVSVNLVFSSVWTWFSVVFELDNVCFQWFLCNSSISLH